MKNLLNLFSWIFSISISTSVMSLEEGQNPPLNHYILGDSISKAFLAVFPADNPSVSWVSGSNSSINSIKRRLDSIYGTERTTTNDSNQGARLISTLKYPLSANREALSAADYITIQVGANDICSVGEYAGLEELPTAEEIYDATYVGLHKILSVVQDGTTIEIVAIPDVTRIYEIGQTKRALGFISCPIVWNIVNTVVPDLLCPSVTRSDVTDDDRSAVKQLNMDYNSAIKQAVLDVKAEIQNPEMALPEAFPVFNDASFFEFDASDVSTWDCFHPSFQGQKELAKRLWENGPFAQE